MALHIAMVPLKVLHNQARMWVLGLCVANKILLLQIAIYLFCYGVYPACWLICFENIAIIRHQYVFLDVRVFQYSTSGSGS